MILARLFFGDKTPSEKTLGEALWLYNDVTERIAIGVANGIGRAFSKD